MVRIVSSWGFLVSNWLDGFLQSVKKRKGDEFMNNFDLKLNWSKTALKRTAVSSSLYTLMVLSASAVISLLSELSKTQAKIPDSLSRDPGWTAAWILWKLYPVLQSHMWMVPLSAEIIKKCLMSFYTSRCKTARYKSQMCGAKYLQTRGRRLSWQPVCWWWHCDPTGSGWSFHRGTSTV